MIIFDLREEAEMASYLYGIGAAAAVLGAAALLPARIRSLLPSALADSLRPLAAIMVLASLVLAWAELAERREAESLAQLCLSGGCDIVQGRVDGVDPVKQYAAGSRYTAPSERGGFQIGDKYFAHHPRTRSGYSPADVLRPGQFVRVYSRDDVMVLVEIVEQP